MVTIAELPPGRRFATIREAADYARVEYKTIRRWIASDRLPAYHAGPRLIRVDLDDLDAMLDRSKVHTGPAFPGESVEHYAKRVVAGAPRPDRETLTRIVALLRSTSLATGGDDV